jgi:septal ring factor EnvC (AmiA/AmiB activator)
MSLNLRTYIFLLVILLINAGLYSQTRQQLERERQELNREISTTQKLLEKTGGSKKKSLASLETLRAQMNSRRQLVQNYRRDLEISEERMRRLDDSIARLERKLKQKTAEYFSTLKKMYRWKKMQPGWMYYISAAGANELFRRWVYLNQLEAWQKERRNVILDLKKTLENNRASIKDERDRRADQLKKEQLNSKALNADIKREMELLTQLKKEESKLRRQLKVQLADKQALNEAISSEIDRGRRAEEKAEKSSFAKTPEGKAITGAFSNNKGRLPWPVQRGVVTRRFGKQAHPTLTNIQIQNNGVDITTESAAIVATIFEGSVVGTAEVPGYQNMIIVRHGKYFTVYSRLQEVFVTRGQKVSRGQRLGRLAVEKNENQSRLHFEIWEDKTKLDPLHWIAKSQ